VLKNFLILLQKELGAVQGKEIVYYDEVIRFEDSDGKVFNFYTDIDRLEQHMKELAPEDKDVIEEFAKGVRTFTNFNLPIEKAPELYSPIDGLKMMFKMLPFLPAMRRWKKVSTHDFAQRFKNPLLSNFFLNWGPPRHSATTPGFFPMMFMLMALSSMHRKSTGYPVGGSLEFSRAIERRYLDLGGKISHKSTVTSPFPY
jgi:phytoene dehydrogenase-like protein